MCRPVRYECHWFPSLCSFVSFWPCRNLQEAGSSCNSCFDTTQTVMQHMPVCSSSGVAASFQLQFNRLVGVRYPKCHSEQSSPFKAQTCACQTHPSDTPSLYSDGMCRCQAHPERDDRLARGASHSSLPSLSPGCVIQGVFEKSCPLLKRLHFLTEELPEVGLDGQDNEANHNKQDIHLRSMK